MLLPCHIWLTGDHRLGTSSVCLPAFRNQALSVIISPFFASIRECSGYTYG